MPRTGLNDCNAIFSIMNGRMLRADRWLESTISDLDKISEGN